MGEGYVDKISAVAPPDADFTLATPGATPHHAQQLGQLLLQTPRDLGFDMVASLQRPRECRQLHIQA